MHNWHFAQKIFWLIAIAWTIMLIAIGLGYKDNENIFFLILSLIFISPLLGVAVRRWHQSAHHKKVRSLYPR